MDLSPNELRLMALSLNLIAWALILHWIGLF